MNDSEQRRRDKTDMQRLIGLILSSPISNTKVMKVDGELSIDQFRHQNTDVRTRMFLQVANMAMNGDIKAADFLMKYGGYEPPKEAEITVELPTFLDDMTFVKQVKASDDSDKLEDPKFVAKALKEGKAKDDIITDDEDVIVCDVSKR